MDITKITDNVYLSGAITNYEQLDDIDVVINCRSECHDAVDTLSKMGISYFWIPVPDWGAPVHEQCTTFLNIIRDCQFKNVLVHCAQGRGRSAMLVMLAVVDANYGEMSVDEAINFVKEKRPIVSLTEIQERKLRIESESIDE